MLETFPLRIAEQTPLFGTIVSPKNPPVFVAFGSPSFFPRQEKKSPPGFEFPMVSKAMQNHSSFGSPFHNSGRPDPGVQHVHNPSAP